MIWQTPSLPGRISELNVDGQPLGIRLLTGNQTQLLAAIMAESNGHAVGTESLANLVYSCLHPIGLSLKLSLDQETIYIIDFNHISLQLVCVQTSKSPVTQKVLLIVVDL